MKLTTILTKLNSGKIKTKTEDFYDVFPMREQKGNTFYGKAHKSYIRVGKTDYRILKSYDTFVAIEKIDYTKHNNNEDYYFTEHSKTTLRHIKAFLGTRETLAELRKGRAE